MNRLNAKERVLILDCCRNEPFSGKGEGENRLIEKMKVSARDILPRGLSKTLSGSGIIYACEAGYRAFEIEDNKSGNGILTRAILEAIEEGRAVVEGRITFEDVSKYVKKRVVELAGLIGQTQFPYIDHAGTALLVFGEKSESAVTKSVIEKPDVSIISQPQVKPVSILQKSSLPEEFTNSIGMEFVLIKAGSFMMGSPDSEGSDYEHPIHKVTITKNFYMGRYQVTQEQYEKVMGTTTSEFKGRRNPVENVSWEDVFRFCQRLTEIERKSGKLKEGRYRLPTEAQWEYCCRAGSTGKYCFGNDEQELWDYAWYNLNSDGKTHPVGEKQPNAWGLYDMHGNVWEWCSDWHGEYPKGDVTDPMGPDNGKGKVSRGGSRRYSPNHLRSAFRFGYDPSYGCYLTTGGFRCARTP